MVANDTNIYIYIYITAAQHKVIAEVASYSIL